MLTRPPPPDPEAPSAALPIHTLGRHLKARFGRRLRRVMLDLGTTCPNRDGTSGFGGCIYCDVHGSGTGAAGEGEDLASQWRTGLARVRRSQPEGPAAILYFQSYSSTWPDLNPLSASLDQARAWAEDAPVLAVGTRPDCFSPEAAALLAEQKSTFKAVWVEFGLETADDKVQGLIGRNDTLASFHKACALAHDQGLEIIVHTIAGLPGEKPDGLLRQVEESVAAGVCGIKFHQLMVLRKTKLASMWKRGEVDLLEPEAYVNMVADALEILPPDIVVHRLSAASPPENHLAPLDWPSPAKVHANILALLRTRGTLQGCRAHAGPLK
jgi:radical SAM protein (TIGR01212 family)